MDKYWDRNPITSPKISNCDDDLRQWIVSYVSDRRAYNLQRKLIGVLRKVIGILWPRRISIVVLYRVNMKDSTRSIAMKYIYTNQQAHDVMQNMKLN